MATAGEAANKYCVAKWKQRTHTTHEEHLAEFSAKEGGNYRTLLLGSSMFERFKTTGAQLVEKESWKSKRIAIAGVGGDGVQHMIHRVENGLLAAVCGGNEGDLDTIVIMAGANNVEDKTCTPEKLFEALVCLVRKTVGSWVEADASGGNKRVIVLSLTPRTSSKPKKITGEAVLEKIREYNRRIAEWAISSPVIETSGDAAVKLESYDAFKPFMKRTGKDMDVSLFCDTVHLNERGYGIFARTIRSALDVQSP